MLLNLSSSFPFCNSTKSIIWFKIVPTQNAILQFNFFSSLLKCLEASSLHKIYPLMHIIVISIFKHFFFFSSGAEMKKRCASKIEMKRKYFNWQWYSFWWMLLVCYQSKKNETSPLRKEAEITYFVFRLLCSIFSHIA